MDEEVSFLTGAQLRQCRLLAGLSVAQFAVELGLNRPTSIREMEAGSKPISGPIARGALVLAGVWPYSVDEPALFEYPGRILVEPSETAAIATALDQAAARKAWGPSAI